MTEACGRRDDERIDWTTSGPFLLMHVAALGGFVVGVRARDVVLCIALYYARMFFITAGYHRYFGHRGYTLSRPVQFLMALGGTTAAQKGVLWWAGHHRHHHRWSDTSRDIHSPKRGFLWSHVGWILARRYNETPWHAIRDFARYPELRFLNEHFLLPPFALAIAVFLWGGWSALFTGFFLSTVLLYHGTFTINSLSHVWGSRRFVTRDTSRNNLWLTLITLGEGWHNNHHYFPATANNGFYWWEVDISYYGLRLMSWLGLASNLRTPPASVLAKNRLADGHPDVGLLGGPVAPLSEARPAT
jgi:stearoyl-CoA desaturase (delta-9 desaturase)